MTNKLIEIIKEINPYEEITEETELIADGILDSLTLVLFISCIEKKFNIKIPDNMIKVETFKNITAIDKMISSLMQ